MTGDNPKRGRGRPKDSVSVLDRRGPSISVRLPESVRQAVRAAAVAETRSVNSLIERVVTAYLRENRFLPPEG